MRKIRILRSSILPVGLLVVASLAWTVGCDRQEAKKTGSDVQTGVDRTGRAIDQSLHDAGQAANRGIREANQEAREAAPKVEAATTRAARAIGNAAEDAGDAAQRGGEKIHNALTPTTQPATH